MLCSSCECDTENHSFFFMTATMTPKITCHSTSNHYLFYQISVMAKYEINLISCLLFSHYKMAFIWECSYRCRTVKGHIDTVRYYIFNIQKHTSSLTVKYFKVFPDVFFLVWSLNNIDSGLSDLCHYIPQTYIVKVKS